MTGILLELDDLRYRRHTRPIDDEHHVVSGRTSIRICGCRYLQSSAHELETQLVKLLVLIEHVVSKSMVSGRRNKLGSPALGKFFLDTPLSKNTALEILRPESAEWLLDRPVSNSGRLARQIRDLSIEHGWAWSVRTAFNPDAEILSADEIAVTSDSGVLDKAARWINLKDYLVREYLPQSWMIDLRT